MEPYNGGGIELNTNANNYSSWGATLKDCKWAGPATPTAYRGFQISVNGGDCYLDHCIAIRGAIGINVDLGETIVLNRCSTNFQTAETAGDNYSSESKSNTAGIRLSGAGSKKAIAIQNCYAEAFSQGIYKESCESPSIENNYIADVGLNSGNSSIYLKDSNVKNVTIRVTIALTTMATVQRLLILTAPVMFLY